MKPSIFSFFRLAKVAACLCSLGLCSQAQALVITNAVTWSGTVQLAGDVSIAASGKLTVAAGTVVRCQANQDATSSGTDSSRVEIIVDGGELLVEGTAQNPVTFTSASATPAAGNWYGIVVNNGNVTLANCIVEYAVKGLPWLDPDIRFNTISLANGTLQRCSEQGFYLEPGGEDQAADLVLDHFKMLNNGQEGVNQTARSRLARLLANGQLDASFDVGSGTNGDVRCMVVQPDGR